MHRGSVSVVISPDRGSDKHETNFFFLFRDLSELPHSYSLCSFLTVMFFYISITEAEW